MSDFDRFVALWETIEKRAEALLAELHEIDPIRGYEHLTLQGIYKCKTLKFTGVESWGYGEELLHEFNIPLRAVFDAKKASTLKKAREWDRDRRREDDIREYTEMHNFDLKEYFRLKARLFGDFEDV